MRLTTKRIGELTGNAAKLLEIDCEIADKEGLSYLLEIIARQNHSAADYFSILRTRVGFDDFELAELDDAGLLPNVSVLEV